ncbi:DNA-3-methyladenine glycosylase II [Natronoarchaeum philippinense]|uniref:DNA-3-methyladenine glycosylase II n=2 Tax=Natronoarchaeum philippinense TaxID=558529 RepID=A0A285N0B4_NATPI|nr:DNA-3-methyladenine glycosylase II [Natronoarchaeum philippinense]
MSERATFADAASVLQSDSVMADLIDRHGPLDMTPADNEFRRLVVSILNQQLSTASARAVRERAFDVLDGQVTPDTVLSADQDALREAGLSDSKVEYVRNCAQAFQERDLTRGALDEYGDDAVIDLLTEIRGVGEWTARMYLIFALGREDVLPLGDLAVRRGIDELYGDGDASMARSEMRAIAESWRPYRSVGTRYVWQAYESE